MCKTEPVSIYKQVSGRSLTFLVDSWVKEIYVHVMLNKSNPSLLNLYQHFSQICWEMNTSGL